MNPNIDTNTSLKTNIVEVEKVVIPTPNNTEFVDLGHNNNRDFDIDNKPKDVMESNWTETVSSFEEMGLKHNLLRGIYANDFELPSPIQQLAIVPMIKGNDVIAQGKAGTGKTATFAISTLQVIDTTINEVQAIVLSPTREIARQTTKCFNDIGQKTMGLKAHYLIGGVELRKDTNIINEGIHVISGTPGRTLSMIDKKILKTTYLKVLIIDEADEMLANNFLPDMKKMISLIPQNCMVWLISATMPKPIVELTSSFMNNPVKILMNKEDLPLDKVKQYYVALKKEWKLDTLIDLYKGIDIGQAMIFCNSKRQVVELSEEMTKRGYCVSAIHSEISSQDERTEIMNNFISGKTRVLVSTDLLAKGIDVYQVNLVINYDFPQSKELYLHRVGRCGRFNRKGNSITFVQTDEMEELKSVQKFYNATIEQLPSDLSEI